MISAIVFDCFGVLAHDGWTPFRKKYIDHDPELLRQVAALGRQADIGNQDSAMTTEAIARLAGVPVEELHKALLSRVPNEDLFDFIRNELKPKYKIGMMTNASFDVLHELFDEKHRQVFDATVLSYESGLAKPDAKMYELIAKRLGKNVQDCLFIDDRDKYVESAEAAGGQALLYESLDQFKRELKKFL
jgi:HAD superfamily hydrolase (TIGR01509 family)